MAKGHKTGGRTAGTPNKNNPFKPALRSHSEAYVRPCYTLDDSLLDMLKTLYQDKEGYEFVATLNLDQLCFLLGASAGDKVSRLDLDASLLAPDKRLDAEIRLANYHSSKMQSTALDMSLSDDTSRDLETRLAHLASQS